MWPGWSVGRSVNVHCLSWHRTKTLDLCWTPWPLLLLLSAASMGFYKPKTDTAKRHGNVRSMMGQPVEFRMEFKISHIHIHVYRNITRPFTSVRTSYMYM